MYEIIYDYCDEDGYEQHNLTETFEGDWLELQAYIKEMRHEGCYNIDANCIDDAM